jgi:hypothetical protein
VLRSTVLISSFKACDSFDTVNLRAATALRMSTALLLHSVGRIVETYAMSALLARLLHIPLGLACVIALPMLVSVILRTHSKCFC